jgi:hypothetical protein
MSTSRVQTECYGYFECLCGAVRPFRDERRNGSRRLTLTVERPSTQPPHCEWYAYAKDGGI